MRPELLSAIDHALAGRWDDAHAICQANEGDPQADWVHAVLHKIEGDAGNADYWYRACGQQSHRDDEPTTELRLIRGDLAV